MKKSTKGIKQQVEEANENKEFYERLPSSIEDFVKMIEEIYKEINNEKPNNVRKQRSKNRS